MVVIKKIFEMIRKPAKTKTVKGWKVPFYAEYDDEPDVFMYFEKKKDALKFAKRYTPRVTHARLKKVI